MNGVLDVLMFTAKVISAWELPAGFVAVLRPVEAKTFFGSLLFASIKAEFSLRFLTGEKYGGTPKNLLYVQADENKSDLMHINSDFKDRKTQLFFFFC